MNEPTSSVGAQWDAVLYFPLQFVPLGEIGSCLLLWPEKLQVIPKADAELGGAEIFQVTYREGTCDYREWTYL